MNIPSKKLLQCILLLVSLIPVSASADDQYLLTVDFDKKVICVDSLRQHLPPSFNAIGVLRLLPEILERPTLSLTSNYDVMIDDVTLGDASDAVLNQLSLAAIDKIEISESPISSYQHNGQGGSINIILKKEEDKRISGNASLDVQYETDILPYAQVNFNTKKFSVTGMVFGEYFNPAVPSYMTTGGIKAKITDEENWRSQMARAIFRYMPNKKDLWRMTLSESTSYSRNDYDIDSWDDGVNKQAGYFTKDKSTTLRASAGYKHTYNPQSELEIQANYVYIPGTSNDDSHISVIHQKQLYTTKDYNTNNLSGKIEYKLNLLPLTAKDKLTLQLGFQDNMTWYKMNTSYALKSNPSTVSRTFDSYDKTLHLMPYLNLECYLGKFKFKATAEYQYYRYYTERSDYYIDKDNLPDYTHERNDITGMLMLCYQFLPHRHLRLTLNRKLQRPSNDQIYPYMNYDEDQYSFIMGNPDLKPMMSHEVALDYISDYSWGDNRLVFNAGVGYNYISDIISLELEENTAEDASTSNYISYKNHGWNNLITGNLMVLYSYSRFSCSLTGNVFKNSKREDDMDNHYTYYNISLLPSMGFGNGWMTSFNLVYHSKLTTASSSTSHCLAGALTIGKNIGNWNFHIFGRGSLTGKVKMTSMDDLSEESWLVRNSIGVGAMVKF